MNLSIGMMLYDFIFSGFEVVATDWVDEHGALWLNENGLPWTDA